MSFWCSFAARSIQMCECKCECNVSVFAALFFLQTRISLCTLPIRIWFACIWVFAAFVVRLFHSTCSKVLYVHVCICVCTLLDRSLYYAPFFFSCVCCISLPFFIRFALHFTFYSSPILQMHIIHVLLHFPFNVSIWQLAGCRSLFLYPIRKYKPTFPMHNEFPTTTTTLNYLHYSVLYIHTHFFFVFSFVSCVCVSFRSLRMLTAWFGKLLVKHFNWKRLKR